MARRMSQQAWSRVISPRSHQTARTTQQSLPETAGYRSDGTQTENFLKQQESFQRRDSRIQTITLEFCWAGWEGAILEREERRVVLVVLVVHLCCCSSSSSSSSSIWYKKILSHVEGEEEEGERKSYCRRRESYCRRG